MENWKMIELHPNYFVSDLGNVKNCKTNRILKPLLHKYGNDIYYKRVSLNGKWLRVHRLVAKAFIPNPDDKPEVDHIDRNPLNNGVNNLRWATRVENIVNRNFPEGVLSHKYIYNVKCGTFLVNIRRNKKAVFSKTFPTLDDAIKSRDEFIKTNPQFCFEPTI